jgi:hypothetical protein
MTETSVLAIKRTLVRFLIHSVVLESRSTILLERQAFHGLSAQPI